MSARVKRIQDKLEGLESNRVVLSIKDNGDGTFLECASDELLTLKQVERIREVQINDKSWLKDFFVIISKSNYKSIVGKSYKQADGDMMARHLEIEG